ncbi:MAG TPA: hypothetical protein VJ508_19810, partial [Saprospiraceae bacterium]|nr:hypothetical protein [Saprospiraceae bacterium]
MIRYHTTWGVLCQIVMLLAVVIQGCKSGQESVTGQAAFYFDLDAFPAGGVTYFYENKLDSLANPEIWHYEKSAPGHLTSINYDPQGRIVQKQFDRIVGNGVLTDSLVLYAYDSTGTEQRIPVKVIANNRLPFDAVDSTKVWLMQLDWQQPKDSLHCVLERRRRFLGYTEWMFNGKKLPAARFRTEDKFETERDGWTTSVWNGEEIYARSLGLVYYKRKISE